MNRKKELSLLFLWMGLLTGMIYLLPVTCLWKALFGIECPTCGMTRAIICLLQGNPAGYLAHNAMAVPVTGAVLMLLACEILAQKKWRRRCRQVAGAILVLNFGWFLLRLSPLLP